MEFVADAKIHEADENDDAWIPAGIVQRLFLYPLKSGQATSVEEAEVTAHGLKMALSHLRDRAIVVTKANLAMLTGRAHPKLVLVQVTEVDDGAFLFAAPGIEDIQVNLETATRFTDELKIWRQKCSGLEFDVELGRWFSRYLGLDDLCRVFYHSDGESTRPRKTIDAAVTPNTRPGDTPLYADDFPFLLVSEESVAELQRRVPNLDIEAKRFRPNIVLSGLGKPHEEDEFARIRVGEKVVFRGVKLCTRCQFTTVDPERGVKHSDGEPYKTLMTYRTAGDREQRAFYGAKPFFGVNLGLEDGNDGLIIRVGDRVSVQYDKINKHHQ